MILSIGRKLSAHLLTTCILCIIILVVLIGGLIQVISSLAFSAYLENSAQQATVFTSSSTSPPISLRMDGTIERAIVDPSNRMNNKNGTFRNANQIKSQNGIHTSVAALKNDRNDKLYNGRGFSNTKILYKPYTPNSNEQLQSDRELSSLNKSPTSASKSKTINSTVYKSVTPSITDRVIADLKKEEFLAQQRAKAEAIDASDNDEAIYIDGDEDDLNTPGSITEIETSVEKLPDDLILEMPDGGGRPEMNTKSKSKPKNTTKKSQQQTIGIRDKKSSKKPAVINQKYKNFGLVDISDTDSSEAVDIDDDDYDDYVNSGSGDFINNQLVDQTSSEEWIPGYARITPKKLSKQERIIKSFTDNSDGISDSSKEVDADAIDFVDKDDDQMISRKFAKAHKKQNAMQSANDKNEYQKPKPKPKPKQNNRQKTNPNNKRKSKEQQYIDEYFSGSKTENNADSEGAEADLVKVQE